MTEPENFDPAPDQSVVDAEDESQWREAEMGLDARHETANGTPNGKPAKARKHAPYRAPRQKQTPPLRVVIEIDMTPGDCRLGYAARSIDLRLDTTAQRAVLKLLAASLDAQTATLSDGTPVRRPQIALQWLLEQIAVRLPQHVLDELMTGSL